MTTEIIFPAKHGGRATKAEVTAVAAVMPKAELDALAHTMAYELATSGIESNCVHVREIHGDGDWWVLPEASGEMHAEVAACVAYLEARGLFGRHDDNPEWITLFDESEAER